MSQKWQKQANLSLSTTPRKTKSRKIMLAFGKKSFQKVEKLPNVCIFQYILPVVHNRHQALQIVHNRRNLFQNVNILQLFTYSHFA